MARHKPIGEGSARAEASRLYRSALTRNEDSRGKGELVSLSSLALNTYPPFVLIVYTVRYLYVDCVRAIEQFRLCAVDVCTQTQRKHNRLLMECRCMERLRESRYDDSILLAKYFRPVRLVAVVRACGP